MRCPDCGQLLSAGGHRHVCEVQLAQRRGLDTIVPITATRDAYMQGFAKGTEALQAHLAVCPGPPMLMCVKCARDLGMLPPLREMVAGDL